MLSVFHAAIPGNGQMVMFDISCINVNDCFDIGW